MDKNFERLLATLKLVSTSTPLSTPDIHRRLTVMGFTAGPRTVQRDLDALAQRFGLERDNRTKPFGWRWPRDRPRLSVPDMEWPEALSFRLLEDYLSGLLPASMAQHLKPYFFQARQKLEEHFHATPIKRWPDKVRVLSPNQRLIPPKVKRSVHEAVTEALLCERQLSIDYQAVGSSGLKNHRVHPLGLVLEGNVLYLVATFFDYKEPRQLAMHRIAKADMLAEACNPPDGFSLSRYVDEGGFGCGGEDLVKLDATWRNMTGLHLLQAQLSEDQVVEELSEGSVRIRATVRYTQRLVWWLMGFGANVEVHGPRQVRKEIASGHREAAELYESNRRAPAASRRAQ